MRKFQVTVNGNTYEVDVAEVGVGHVSTPVVSAPVAQVTQSIAPKAVVATSAPVSAPASAAVGETLLEAPMQGKIVAVKVTAGQKVIEGDIIAVLEAMKMENELVAPKAGTVVSVDVAAGQTVEAGDLIASLD